MAEIGSESTESASGGGGLPIARLVLLGLAIVALVWVGRTASAHLLDFVEWVRSLGFWGPAVFMLGYAVAVVGFVPGSILTAAGGFIFGVVAGTGYVFVAATLGACAAFLVARHLAREPIEHKLAGNERFAAIDRAVSSQGRRIVFLLRLSPIFPFNLLNYGLGLTGVRFSDYAVACLGMLPGTLLYVYLGSLLSNLAAVAAGETGVGDAQQRWIFLGGLAVTAVVTILITRIARRALREATGE